MIPAMDLAQRTIDIEQRFEQLRVQHDGLAAQAAECMVEMNKLQGEWRLLQELSQAGPDKPEAATIEAVAEEGEIV